MTPVRVQLLEHGVVCRSGVGRAGYVPEFRSASTAMAPGRLKQWLGMLRHVYPETKLLHRELCALHDPEQTAQRLDGAMAGCSFDASR